MLHPADALAPAGRAFTTLFRMGHLASRSLATAALSTACALLALVAVLASPASAASAKVPAGWMGVSATDGSLLGSAPLWAGETKVMKGAGVQSVRVPFYWNAMQPFGPGPVSFTASDVVVEGASRQGLRLLPIVLGTPAWAAKDPEASRGWSAPRSPAEYGTFLSELAKRYGPKGTFWTEHPDVPRRPIGTWQAWNEPDLDAYWAQQPFAKGYVALLKAARTALRAVDPKGRIMLAGFPNRSWQSLEKVYKAKGGKLFDVAAVHGYTGSASNVIRLVDENRKVMARYHDARKPIAVTEMGFSSAPKSVDVPQYVTWNTTEAGQAKKVTELYASLAAKRASRRIEGAYWYSWYVPETSGKGGWEDYTGLRHLDGQTIVSKPALAAYAKVAKKLRR